jgi:hypothetical protein
MKRQVNPDNPHKEFEMLHATFNTFAAFDDGIDTPKRYKNVLKALRKINMN